MMISSIQSIELQMSVLAKVIISVALPTLIIAALVTYYKKDDTPGTRFTSIFQGSIRYNTYIFFGLGGSLFKQEGLSLVASISALMIIITNILSVLVFYHYIPREGEDKNLIIKMSKGLASNPLIISSFIGLFLNYFEIKMSPGILKTLNSLSGSAFAIGCLIIGSALRFDFKNYSTQEIKDMAFSISIKLLLFPMLTVIVTKILGVTGVAKFVCILFAGLPTATNSYILSRQLGGDYVMMSNIITITTVLSLFTLSLILYIFL
jgi:malonate transporter and related proteins